MWLRSYQSIELYEMKKNHVSIGLINPKDAQNVGSVLRAIGCYQANDVYFTGNRYEYALKHNTDTCLLYTSPSPRDKRQSRMPSSA